MSLSADKTRILPFYLAMEEYVSRLVDKEDMFFMWQVEPTVIYGRNQIAELEVDLPYCRAHGIATYRRKSGGGCVYADLGNIMLSYITRSDNVSSTFKRYTGAVVASLRQLGLNASDNSRNDILIDGLKVSGNAFYHLPGRSIVHGTMLYDTNMEHMTQAITPSRAKMASKGVASVASHITTLRQHLDMDLESVKRHLRNSLCESERTLTDEETSIIEDIMQDYLRPEFRDSHRRHRGLSHAAHIDGVGELQLSMDLSAGIITGLEITGDYFLLSDLDKGLTDHLKGCRCDRETLTNALATVDVSQVIMNLSNQQLIELLTEPNNE